MRSLKKIVLIFLVLSFTTSVCYYTGITGNAIGSLSEKAYSSTLIIITLLWLILYIFIKNPSEENNYENAEIVKKKF